jgi:hypothetical protein
MMMPQNIKTFEEEQLGTLVAIEAGEVSTAPDSAADELSQCESDPAGEGTRVVQGLRSGARAIINACVVVASTVRRHEKDRASIDKFIGALVDGNVVSQAEARMGLASPKVSKLRTIGDHATLLLREDIFQHLSPSYSLMHLACVLFSSLIGNEEARVGELVKIFAREGTLSRNFLEDQIKQVKSKSVPKTSTSNGPLKRTADKNAEVSSHAHDVVFLEPNDRDIRRLNDDYPDELPPCLRVNELIAEDASAIVITRLIDLPIVVNKLLPYCGFDCPSRIMLAQDPNSRDVTNAEIVMVAVRGQKRFDLPENFAWPPIGEPIDINSIVAALVPDVENKLHIFASDETEGWSSVIGEANWSQADE